MVIRFYYMCKTLYFSRPACYPKRCDICREKFVGTYLPSIDCEKTCGQCQVCATNPGAFPFCGTICTRSYSYCVATCKTDQKICLSCSGFCGLWKYLLLLFSFGKMDGMYYIFQVKVNFYVKVLAHDIPKSIYYM